MGGAGDFAVRVANFEGPLALLLRLIEERQLDVTEVSLAKVTDQYLQHLERVRELNLEVASEFAVIAARLLELKARALLPGTRPADEEVPAGEDEDSAEDLVRRLLEYRQFRDAAETFRQLAEAEGLRYTRIPEDLEALTQEAELEGLSVADLLRAFAQVLRAAEERTPPPLEVRREPLSVAQRMREVVDRVRAAGGRVHFHGLFGAAPGRFEVVVTFLAVLELLRRRRLRAVQPAPLGPIELVLMEPDGAEP